MFCIIVALLFDLDSMNEKTLDNVVFAVASGGSCPQKGLSWVLLVKA